MSLIRFVLRWMFVCVAVNVINGQTLLEDVYLREAGDRVVFGNKKLSLEFGASRGEWLSLNLEGVRESVISQAKAGEALDFRLDQTWMIERSGATLLRREVSVDRMRNGVTLSFTFGVGRRNNQSGKYEYELTSSYKLFPAEMRVERAAQLVRQPTSDQPTPVKMQGFLFRLPGAVLVDPTECVVDVPGPFFPKTFVAPAAPYNSLISRQIQFHSAPDAGFGLVAMSNERRNLSMGVWMNTGGEVAYRASLDGDGQRLTVSDNDLRAYRLKTGEKVESDAQQIVFANGPLASVLVYYRRMLQETMPLAATPDWARRMVILEVYPQYFAGGIKGLTGRLPFYREIGFNTIYLMPHWVGGYSPIDLYEVEPLLGTSDDLKAMVAAAHALGMRVLFDMVIHGFNEKSPVTKERPELFVHDENGKLALHPTWKSVTTDWAAPAYQSYMNELVTHDLKTYGIDGYRVDAATYKGPGWDPELPYPAYRSGSAAPELMKGMLAAMRRVRPEAVLLSEVFGPVFYTVCNLVHDNQTEAPQLILEKMEAGEIDAAHYKAHLADVFDALPAGANRVYYTRNHDTSWFYHFNGYTPRFLAMEAVHALFAIPEVFAGDPKNGPHPDADPRVYDYYRKLFALRERMPELIDGEVLLREAESDNKQVLTGLRRMNNQLTLIAISFSDKNEEAGVTIKIPRRRGKLKLLDLISGETVEASATGPGLILKLKPFQVLVGRL